MWTGERVWSGVKKLTAPRMAFNGGTAWREGRLHDSCSCSCSCVRARDEARGTARDTARRTARRGRTWPRLAHRARGVVGRLWARGRRSLAPSGARRRLSWGRAPRWPIGGSRRSSSSSSRRRRRSRASGARRSAQLTGAIVEKGDERDAWQVLANGGVFAAAALVVLAPARRGRRGDGGRRGCARRGVRRHVEHGDRDALPLAAALDHHRARRAARDVGRRHEARLRGHDRGRRA